MPSSPACATDEGESERTVQKRNALTAKLRRLQLTLEEGACAPDALLRLPQDAALLRALASISSGDVVEDVPNLRCLRVEANAMDNDVMDHLAQLSPLFTAGKLMELSLCIKSVSPALQSMGRLPILTELDLSDTHIIDCELIGLSEIRGLVRLRLTKCIHLVNISPLASITTLEELNLRKSRRLREVSHLGKLPALRILDLFGTDVSDDAIRGLSASRSIVELNLSECYSLSSVSSLPCILTLEELEIQSSYYIRDLGVLGKLPALRRLDLSSSRVTDAVLVGLGESRSLVELSLSYCKKVRNVSPLASIHTMERLILRGCENLRDVSRLCNLPALRFLKLSEEAINEKSLDGLSKSRSLSHIHLLHCPTEKYFSLLSKISFIQCIEIESWNYLSGAHVLGDLCTLRYLTLRGASITDTDLTALNKCRHLVKLFFSYCVEIKDVSPLASISTLEDIYLERVSQARGFGSLGRLPRLRSLSLSSFSINKEEFAALCKSPSIVKLGIDASSGPINVAPLALMKTLEDLKLSSVDGYENVGDLGKLPRLHSVMLQNRKTTQGDIQKLGRSRSIVNLHLAWGGHLKDISSLAKITTLETVGLFGCEHLENIGPLGNLPVLRHLELGNVGVIDSAFTGLGRSRSLVDISFSHCGVFTDLSALASIPTLQNVSMLHCNSLNHVGALGKLPMLRRMTLSSTCITDDGFRGLQESSSIVELDVSFSYGHLTTLSPIANISSLQKLRIAYCDELTRVSNVCGIKALRRLEISGLPISDEELVLLGRSQSIVDISIRFCKNVTNANPLASIITLDRVEIKCCPSISRVGDLGTLPALRKVYFEEILLKDDELIGLGRSRSIVELSITGCPNLTDINPLANVLTLEELTLESCGDINKARDLGNLPGLYWFHRCQTRIPEEELNSFHALRRSLHLPPLRRRR